MKYSLTNFLGALLVYAIGVSLFAYVSRDIPTGYFNWKQGLEVMGVISGFIIAYLVAKNMKDKGEPF